MFNKGIKIIVELAHGAELYVVLVIAIVSLFK